MKRSNIVLTLMLIYGLFLNILPLVSLNYPINPNTSASGYFFSIVIYLLLLMIGMYYKLEESELSSKEIVLIAIYSTFVGISRVPFAAIPSVQPCSYLIFSAGWVFGPLIGFVIGINNVLISNIFLGHGPWSLYQMFAWGSFGVLGGLLNLKGNKQPNMYLNMFLGFAFGLIFGWMLNLWYFLLFIPEKTWATFLLANVPGLYFDVSHAIGNVVFFGAFGNKTIQILYRFRTRFLFNYEEKEYAKTL